MISFATKCEIPKDKLIEDLHSLIPIFNSLTDSENNPFLESDIEEALKIYGSDKAYKFKRDYIALQCGIEIPKAKRNGRTRREHLKRLHLERKRKKELGLLEPVKRRKQEKTKAQIILKEYLLKNQDGKKKTINELSDNLNLSNSTVKKYYENIEKEIFLETYPKYSYLNDFIKNLNKIDFFIFKTIIENPNATRNKISKITGIGYPAICKY